MAKKRHHSGMISEDHSSVANMPQGVRYDSWAKAFKGFDSDLNDTLEGIDRQMESDTSTAKRHNVPKKW